MSEGTKVSTFQCVLLRNQKFRQLFKTQSKLASECKCTTMNEYILVLYQKKSDDKAPRKRKRQLVEMQPILKDPTLSDAQIVDRLTSEEIKQVGAVGSMAYHKLVFVFCSVQIKQELAVN